MTNKLPEVGKKYKRKPIVSDEIMIVNNIYEFNGETRVSFKGKDWSEEFLDHSTTIKRFLEEYEPLEDNSQNTPQSAISEEDNCKPVVKDCLIIDEVEKAREELKKEIERRKKVEFAPSLIHEKVQALFDALDKQDVSKSDPKIDMKEENVDPVNIKTETKPVADNKIEGLPWKDINLLNGEIVWNEDTLTKKPNGSIVNRHIASQKEMNLCQFLTLTDLITTIESMLERINKLENEK